MARYKFPEWTENFKKWTLLLAAGAPVFLIALIAYGVTPEAIRIGYQPTQPVPYSHAIHVGKLGLDCRYCHNTVEKSSHSAVPPAATCMNCHRTIHSTNHKLEPVRAAYAGGDPVEWVRVHDLPDYVFFNHSAHVNRGVGCESCHGRVDRMEVVYQAKALTMSWCLDCHNDPYPHIRPTDVEVTKMGYLTDVSESERRAAGKKRAEEWGLAQMMETTGWGYSDKINPLVDCSTCHR